MRAFTRRGLRSRFGVGLLLAALLSSPGLAAARPGDTCPSNNTTTVKDQITICVSPSPPLGQGPAAGGCGACAAPNTICPTTSVAGKCCSNLSEAIFIAVAGDTIGVFGPTTEPAAMGASDVGPNVIISGPYGSPFASNQVGAGQGLRIEECSNAKINAGDSSSPVIDIQSGAGQILINGLDVLGGTAGIRVGNSGTPQVRGSVIKAVRAESNAGAGIEITGSFNNINGVVATLNDTGVEVSDTGSGNLIRSTRANGNASDGFLVTGNGNDLRGNEANNNGGIGFNMLGTGNMLRSNQSNRSSQGGAKENVGCEYNFANNSTQDLTGNKKDNVNFVGTILTSPKRYAQGCYE